MTFLRTKYIQKVQKEAEEAVCKLYKVTPDVIYSRSRHRQACHARFAVWLILNAQVGLSTVVIGSIYGYDHTTVSNGVERARQMGMDAELDIYSVDSGVDKSINGGDKVLTMTAQPLDRKGIRADTGKG